MRCSWSEDLRRTLTPRLALALAASAALYALVAADGPAGPFEVAAQDRSVPRQAGKASPGAQRYYRTRELDVVPGIMTRTNPEYPDMARVSGKVLIRLFIDERGSVEHVAILRAEPPNVFDASARRAFLAARFTPGMKAGVAVKSQLTLQVDYTQPR